MAYSDTILTIHRPHQEVCFADTVEYRCQVRVLSAKLDGIVTSLFFRGLLSTSDHYSVIFPFEQQQGIRPIFERIPISFTPTWFGISCEVVKLWIGLSIEESPHPRPFQLTALIPLDRDAIPEDVPPLLRIGAEFLHSQRAEVSLSYEKGEGRLRIPYH